MTLAPLIDRTYKLTAIRQPTGFVGQNPQFFERLDNATIFTNPTAIKYQIKKSLGKEPNTCVIRIYNQSADTRAGLEKLPLRVVLEVGYGGENRLLFTGDVKRAWSERENGTEVATILHVGDSLRAYSYARMNRSYKPPITMLRVLQDAANSMGVTLPPSVEQDAQLKQAIATGISTHGPTRDVLTKLLARYGYNWSVQNGKLVVLVDEQSRPGQAILVNQSTGLIGAPQKAEPQSPKKQGEIKFKTLVYPEIEPGKLVQIESEFINATIKVTDVHHDGDLWGDEWDTAVTGRPL